MIKSSPVLETQITKNFGFSEIFSRKRSEEHLKQCRICEYRMITKIKFLFINSWYSLNKWHLKTYNLPTFELKSVIFRGIQCQ